jgi:hypothetical protein
MMHLIRAMSEVPVVGFQGVTICIPTEKVKALCAEQKIDTYDGLVQYLRTQKIKCQKFHDWVCRPLDSFEEQLKHKTVEIAIDSWEAEPDYNLEMQYEIDFRQMKLFVNTFKVDLDDLALMHYARSFVYQEPALAGSDADIPHVEATPEDVCGQE